MTALTGTKKLTFKKRRRKSILCFFIVVISVLVQADICQAVIVEGQWSWHDEQMLRRGVWFESFESGPFGPGIWAFGPRTNNDEFLWSLSHLVPEGSEANQFPIGHNGIMYTTEWIGNSDDSFVLGKAESLWGEKIVFDDVKAKVAELKNTMSDRVVWRGISLSGMSSDGISVEFSAELRSWIDWPCGRFGRVKKINIAIAPEPSTILIFGLLSALCLPYGKFVNKVRDSNSY